MNHHLLGLFGFIAIIDGQVLKPQCYLQKHTANEAKEPPKLLNLNDICIKKINSKQKKIYEKNIGLQSQYINKSHKKKNKVNIDKCIFIHKHHALRASYKIVLHVAKTNKPYTNDIKQRHQ